MAKINVDGLEIETEREQSLEREHSNDRVIYLGDAVYAEFDGDGIWLRTNDHRDSHCHDSIYLEPKVLDNLNRFYESMIAKRL